MRSYPLNSPQAAARIVALAMVADGQLGQAEVDVLVRLNAPARLGLLPSELHLVVRGLCEDLLLSLEPGDLSMCHVDERMLAQLMAEIDDPKLRRKVLGLSVAVVEADSHVTDGEALVLVAAVEHWGMHRTMLETGAPPL